MSQQQHFSSDFIDFDDDDFQPLPQSVFEDDIKSMTPPAPATPAKKLPDVVSIDNICDHYHATLSTNDTTKLDHLKKFIKKISASNILKILKTEQKLDPDLQELLHKTLMRGIFSIASKDMPTMLYETLLMLLTRNDYEFGKSDSKYDLENALCSLMVSWFGYHPTEPTERYKECFNKLRKDILLPESVGRLTTCPQYKALENELALEFVKIFSSIALNKKATQHQRNLDPIYNSPNDDKLMTEALCKNLKLHDLIDAKDKQGMWYVATVVDITPISAYVSFSGWSDKDNEWILFTDKRIAKRGTITNGELHSLGSDCSCHKCKFVPPNPANLLKGNELSNMISYLINTGGFPAMS
ncbi:MAG: hypothetical protein Hyperionvirus15_28 [Hyperionvirus sp.]|uniref:Uncharacterized protein n=1 Tax=Hyperionvirus sp. TaxID=2487770 RepID=A0A3G5A9Q6_9VIRU|nr:MAG: hypothetical protein Hyperionvirus15_28 [Hyperionvirus sp.]